MIKVGLLGFGTVNTGVYEGLIETQQYVEDLVGDTICIEKILVRNLEKYKDFSNQSLLTADQAHFLDYEFDIVFEAMGGTQPALDFVTYFLSRSVPVITANKELIAKHGQVLEELAKGNKTFLGYEGAVGGGIPVINVLKSQLRWTSISKISGILNGTTNYILTELANGHRSFTDVLKEAQQLGYAESDPTNDVEGYDALYKLQILCKLCFGIWPKETQFSRRGITHLDSEYFTIANSFDLHVKYIAEASFNGEDVVGSITPALVSDQHPLSTVVGVNNGIFLESDWLGEFMITGPGAGKTATATSMIEDYLHHLQIVKTNTSYSKRRKPLQKDKVELLLVFESGNEQQVIDVIRQQKHDFLQGKDFPNYGKKAYRVNLYDVNVEEVNLPAEKLVIHRCKEDTNTHEANKYLQYQ